MSGSQKNIALIVPMFNESASISQVLNDLANNPDVDVYVVDDASSDNSKALVQQAGVVVLPLAVNLGAWNAIQTGMRYALRKNYQWIMTMDADGQHPVSEIPKLILASVSELKPDVVIGACASRGSKLRKFAWRFFRRLTGVGIEDLTSGFRLYNKKAVEKLVSKKGTLLDYQDVGVLLILQQAQLKVMEVQVDMEPRKFGGSHIFSSWMAVAYYMMVTTLLSLSKRRTSVVQQ